MMKGNEREREKKEVEQAGGDERREFCKRQRLQERNKQKGDKNQKEIKLE